MKTLINSKVFKDGIIPKLQELGFELETIRIVLVWLENNLVRTPEENKKIKEQVTKFASTSGFIETLLDTFWRSETGSDEIKTLLEWRVAISKYLGDIDKKEEEYYIETRTKFLKEYDDEKNEERKRRLLLLIFFTFGLTECYALGVTDYFLD